MSDKETKVNLQPNQQSVFEFLLKDGGEMEADAKKVVRAGLISKSAADFIFQECIRHMIADQFERMKLDDERKQIAAQQAHHERPVQ